MITRRISLVPLQTISRSHFLIPCLVYRHLHSTIFNDIFDNCRFVTIITSSIMKLADHMTYTYIYRSFDPSNFRNRSSIRIPSKGFIFIVPLLVKKKKNNNYHSIQQTTHPFVRSSSFSTIERNIRPFTFTHPVHFPNLVHPQN